MNGIFDENVDRANSCKSRRKYYWDKWDGMPYRAAVIFTQFVFWLTMSGLVIALVEGLDFFLRFLPLLLLILSSVLSAYAGGYATYSLLCAARAAKRRECGTVAWRMLLGILLFGVVLLIGLLCFNVSVWASWCDETISVLAALIFLFLTAISCFAQVIAWVAGCFDEEELGKD